MVGEEGCRRHKGRHCGDTVGARTIRISRPFPQIAGCLQQLAADALPRTPDVRFAIFVPRQGHVGTVNYCPLEILLGGSELSPTFDVWGGGLL